MFVGHGQSESSVFKSRFESSCFTAMKAGTCGHYESSKSVDCMLQPMAQLKDPFSCSKLSQFGQQTCYLWAWLKMKIRGWWNGSVDKGSCCQVWWSVWSPTWSREKTDPSKLLTDLPRHHPGLSTHHKQINKPISKCKKFRHMAFWRCCLWSFSLAWRVSNKSQIGCSVEYLGKQMGLSIIIFY